MRITIEIEDNFPAKLTIDGREMTVVSDGNCTVLEGIAGDDLDRTFGGIVAGELYSTIDQIQEARARLNCRETWDELDEETAQEVVDDLWI